MPDLATLGVIAGSILTLAAVAKVFVTAWRKLSGGVRRVSGALDNIAGRDAFVDPATGKQVEAIPPIGQRFSGIEARLDGLADTDKRFTVVDSRLNAIDTRLNEHESLIGLLGGSTFERGAEALLKAVEVQNADVIDVQEDS